MFRNYFVVAIRNFTRHKLYSFINVAGLTIGLACAILIGLYVRDELSFDRWLPDSERLYLVDFTMHPPGQDAVDLGGSPIPLGRSMIAELPGIEAETHLAYQADTIKIGERSFLDFVCIVDPSFFSVIRLPFAAGNPTAVFRNPNTVVLSQTAARKYFGEENPVGKLMVFDNKTTRMVTGVIRDLPYNTQFDGNIFVPYRQPPPAVAANGASQTSFETDEWTRFPAKTYVRLAPGVSTKSIATDIPALLLRHFSSQTITSAFSVLGVPIENIFTAKLVPLRDVHLTANIHHGVQQGDSLETVYGFAAIALLIVLTACFNFTNLATARATLRSREVGLRKMLGATRRQLMVQFLAESVMTALIAMILAFAAVEMALPAYGRFLGHAVAFDYFRNWPFTLAVIGTAVAAGLIGGFYPALVISGFRPAAALRPAAGKSSRTGLLRTALVVFQFAVSIGLGIAAIVIFAQINYAREIDLGFDKDNLVAISLEQANLPQAAEENLMRMLADEPDIEGASLSSSVPGDEGDELNFVYIPGRSEKVSVKNVSVSPEFFSIYGIKLVAGRFLSRDFGNDLNHGGGLEDGKNVVIDEYAARAFGFTPRTAIGKRIKLVFAQATVVGVVKNALFQGAQAIGTSPTIYYYNPTHTRRVTVRLKGGHIPEALASLDADWNRFVPDVPVTRWFLDEKLNNLYAGAEKQGVLLAVFVGIAIAIAALGLFGLAAFTVAQRTKEIGIRKVFGARTSEIVRLLLWQFSIPVLAANLVAWPVAYFYLRHWLEGYAYHISLNPLVFLTAGLAALFVAWATVIAHAVAVARRNPIEALRYE